MNKKMKLIAFMLITLLEMTGCGETNLGDSYVEGSDYQYQFEGSFSFNKKMARGSNGYFFAMGRYIYYLEDDTQKLVPLCNKADCLHNEETDENRYGECNAYINNSLYSGDVGISYCNGYLYYIDRDDEWCQSLYRMKEDGSAKESIYKWDDWIVNEWCTHRDILYFAENIYKTVTDEQNKTETIEYYAVKKLALTGMGKKQPETIYEVEEGQTVYSLSKVKAYGNHVYFSLHAASEFDTSVITDDNVYDYVYIKQIKYDTNTGECKVLALPEEKKGVNINSITFWNGQLILNEYDDYQELDGTANSYISDLDGSNAKIFQTDKIQGESYISDGKYLYISNSIFTITGAEEKHYYRVYDQDMNLVDTLEVPVSDDPEIGMEEGSYMYKLNENRTGLELMFFDKSTIGTYHGSSTRDSYRKIAEINLSPEDLAEVQSMEESE